MKALHKRKTPPPFLLIQLANQLNREVKQASSWNWTGLDASKSRRGNTLTTKDKAQRESNTNASTGTPSHPAGKIIHMSPPKIWRTEKRGLLSVVENHFISLYATQDQELFLFGFLHTQKAGNCSYPKGASSLRPRGASPHY